MVKRIGRKGYNLFLTVIVRGISIISIFGWVLWRPLGNQLSSLFRLQVKVHCSPHQKVTLRLLILYLHVRAYPVIQFEGKRNNKNGFSSFSPETSYHINKSSPLLYNWPNRIIGTIAQMAVSVHLPKAQE